MVGCKTLLITLTTGLLIEHEKTCRPDPSNSFLPLRPPTSNCFHRYTLAQSL